MSLAREPVSVLYGGAHLFKPDAAIRLGGIALRTFTSAADNSDPLYAQVRQKLEREAVEDLRIDFEDGYGVRSDEEEDGHATLAGEALASAGTPFIGVRVNLRRPERTLDRFFKAAGKLPSNFVVTFPKVTHPREVSAFVRLLERLEQRHGLGRLKIELMAETPELIKNPEAFLLAGETRVESLHFGAYDYLSSFDIAADHQHLMHAMCDDARMRLKLSGARIVDGATSILPLGNDVARALALHEQHVTHALKFGIYQGWDLHPAQLVARYFALYRFFANAEPAMRPRLLRFIEEEGRARATGGVFDDAATARGVALFYLRGHTTGALTSLPVPLDTLLALGSSSLPRHRD